jgi:hypothetical protein
MIDKIGRNATIQYSMEIRETEVYTPAETTTLLKISQAYSIITCQARFIKLIEK